MNHHQGSCILQVTGATGISEKSLLSLKAKYFHFGASKPQVCQVPDIRTRKFTAAASPASPACLEHLVMHLGDLITWFCPCVTFTLFLPQGRNSTQGTEPLRWSSAEGPGASPEHCAPSDSPQILPVPTSDTWHLYSPQNTARSRDFTVKATPKHHLHINGWDKKGKAQLQLLPAPGTALPGWW